MIPIILALISSAQSTTVIKVSEPIHAMAAAQVPIEGEPVLIPQPERNHMSFAKSIEFSGRFTFPIGLFDHFEVFEQALRQRFTLPRARATDASLAIDGGVTRMGLRTGGYKIEIAPGKVSVLGNDDQGLINGCYRLAQLAYVKDGKLRFPTGYIMDQPGVTWRGVHLFVGPSARAFHEKLWTRLLRPLMFNKVVLQCERTAWLAQPKINTAITMPRSELVKTFAMYRGLGVEPIPLIQSFGHMEWLFENGQNRELAMNPEALFSVDPRKPGTWKALNQIWAEAISVLKPETIHFGLDQVSMLGWPKDPALVTELWKQQLTFLADIAKFHKVRPMLWGDMMLGPGEGPDALNIDSPTEAEKRRSAVPKGSLIGDCHYVADAKPDSYKSSLERWKDAGMRPIATSLYEPANIRGFNVAANLYGAGTLQTTGTGLQSTEQGMIAALNQFSAMVLAADYAWSGRKELPEQLPYDPTVVLRRMMFDGPQSVRPVVGAGLGSDPTKGFVIEGTQFIAMSPVALASGDGDGANEILISGASLSSESVNKIAFALDTRTPVKEGEVVAQLSISTPLGLTTRNIVYGQDVRSEKDTKPTSMTARERGLSRLVVDLGERAGQVTRISLKSTNSRAGLRVSGVTYLKPVKLVGLGKAG